MGYRENLMVRYSGMALLAVVGIVHVSASHTSYGVARPGDHVGVQFCQPRERDFTYHFWCNGYNTKATAFYRHEGTRNKEGGLELAFLSGRYGMVIDTERLQISHLGALTTPHNASYERAANFRDKGLHALPSAPLKLELAYQGKRYHFARIDSPYLPNGSKDETLDSVRVMDSGRFVQRVDFHRLVLETEQGEVFPFPCHFEIVAEPRAIHFILGVRSREQITARIHVGEERSRPIAVKTLDSNRLGWRDLAALTLAFEEKAVCGTVTVSLAGRPLVIERDTRTGIVNVMIPQRDLSSQSKMYFPVEHLDEFRRFPVTVSNESTNEASLLLRFYSRWEKQKNHQGIAGFTPMLLDPHGEPTGTPLQVSKQWHGGPEHAILGTGTWYHNYTLLRLPPGTRTEFVYGVTYGAWGGIPGASHAQLTLAGWQDDHPLQEWSQVAIGSFGESICYAPGRSSSRATITDWRPLLCYNKIPGAYRRYNWTDNSGGGDFLTYYKNDIYVGFRGSRTRYLSPGPNLTDARFHHTTKDGAIRCEVRVRTSRSGGLNRSYHSFRYDVLKDTTFSRLALFQMGADFYLPFQDSTFAVGNAAGLTQTYDVIHGGQRYNLSGIPLKGEHPWVMMYGAEDRRKLNHLVTQSQADRLMIVRNWRARIQGQGCPVPFFGSYGAESYLDVATADIMLPPEVTRLSKGDSVECLLENVLVPVSYRDYYGHSAELRRLLRASNERWQTGLALAKANHVELDIHKGTTVSRYPPTIQAGEGEVAELDMSGGFGCVPIQFTGLSRHAPYTLYERIGAELRPVDQSVHGKDFYQCTRDDQGVYTRTYNIECSGSRTPRRFLFSPGDTPVPTPRIASRVFIEPAGGVFDEQVTVAMSGQAHDCTIHYTVDGTPVTEHSPAYRAPFLLKIGNVGNERTIRAALFGSGYRPSLENVSYLHRSLRPVPRPEPGPVPPTPQVRIDSLSPLRRTPVVRSKRGSRQDWQTGLNYRGQSFGGGVGVQGACELVYHILPAYRRFVAVVGLTSRNWVHPSQSSIVFKVYADDTFLAESPILTLMGPRHGTVDYRHWCFDLALPEGTKTLHLVTTDAGDGPEFDHGDWCAAGFITDSTAP
jgi:hypothetical protein